VLNKNNNLIILAVSLCTKIFDIQKFDILKTDFIFVLYVPQIKKRLSSTTQH